MTKLPALASDKRVRTETHNGVLHAWRDGQHQQGCSVFTACNKNDAPDTLCYSRK